MDTITIHSKEELISKLFRAWITYRWLFQEPPHGTIKQLSALVELMGINKDASLELTEKDLKEDTGMAL